MAYVLSLRPQSPLKRSFSDNRCSSPSKPLMNANINNPLLKVSSQNLSVTSLTSLKSVHPGPRLRGGENAPPSHTARSLRNFVRDGDGDDKLKQVRHVRQSAQCRISTPPREPHYFEVQPDIFATELEISESGDSSEETEFSEQDSSAQLNSTAETSHDFSDCFDLYDTIHIPLPDVKGSDKAKGDPCNTSPEHSITVEISPPPFKRWMSTLRKRHAERRKDCTPPSKPWPPGMIDEDAAFVSPLRHIPGSARTHSGSVSSSVGFVTAIRSASITIASASIAHRSDAGGVYGRGRMDNRSSNFSEARRSMDSNMASLGPIIDESAWLRSVQRRKIIEELISSEESYIGDLKVLINDYFMLFASLPTLPAQTRASIHHNISQILQLHQDLLDELHLAVPHADFTQTANEESYPVTKAKHIRFHSADMIPGRLVEHKATCRVRHSLEIGRSPDRRPRAVVTDTKTVGQVAKIFNKYMKRFFAYEEYGAHWTTMSQDLTSMCKGLQGWNEYERGVETLSKVLTSENNREANSKKALSFSDLLIKPIQRVCKYPLLFNDLCRHTPVYDDPEAHAELEKALFRLQEAIREVNKAKDDPKRRKLIETSWYLQDRLDFQQQSVSRAVVFRLLGHVVLCGVLHVAFQGHSSVQGCFMICVLYKSCLVLAQSNRACTRYTVVAAISLANASIEEPDNGRGLQCHTAPFTWKLVFEHNHRLHEIILSACSNPEEHVWKNKLRDRILCETHDLNEGRSTMQDLFSSLTLDIKSIGPVFGRAESLIRRMSVHRSATMGPMTKAPSTAQVIIKNTQAQKAQETMTTPPPFGPVPVISRSQSDREIHHIPTLNPRRADRIRLESALEEVWTKDILPYPGMGARRTENIRASANSVMRKLSMASIASNFSRRSPSFSNLSHTRSEESFGGRAHKFSQGGLRSRSAMGERRPAPALVDFHTAPAAFLPADFELQDRLPSSSRRRRIVNRGAAFATERGGSGQVDKISVPGSAVKPKRNRTGRLSTHIITLPRTDEYHIVTSNGDRTVSESSNTGTVLHTPGSAVRAASESYSEGRKRGRGNEGVKEDGGGGKAASTIGGVGAGTPGSKKFLKSRSKIFKFWM